LENKREVDWVRQVGFAQRRMQVKMAAKMSQKRQIFLKIVITNVIKVLKLEKRMAVLRR
jgi:hypothetical protein